MEALKSQVEPCPICLVAYDTVNTVPHIMGSCGHTFCLKCINSLPNKKCPQCRVISTTFPKNFGFIQLLGLLAFQDPNKAIPEKRWTDKEKKALEKGIIKQENQLEKALDKETITGKSQYCEGTLSDHRCPRCSKPLYALQNATQEEKQGHNSDIVSWKCCECSRKKCVRAFHCYNCDYDVCKSCLCPKCSHILGWLPDATQYYRESSNSTTASCRCSECSAKDCIKTRHCYNCDYNACENCVCPKCSRPLKWLEDATAYYQECSKSDRVSCRCSECRSSGCVKVRHCYRCNYDICIICVKKKSQGTIVIP